MTMSAAYFFFLRRSMDLYSPSISISKTLKRLSESFLNCFAMSTTSAMFVDSVLIMIESVSP